MARRISVLLLEEVIQVSGDVSEISRVREATC